MTRRLVLASASPRRHELLIAAGLELDVVPAHVDEAPLPGEAPVATALRLAVDKARTVAVRYPDEVVLGADTVVVIGGVALGKPVDEAEAGDMLRRLSGHWHQVVTGVCLTRAGDGWERAWTCATDVRFRELDHAGIQRYIARVHVLDKAGAYAIQECGEMIVAETRGLVSNVIGLPVEEVVRELP